MNWLRQYARNPSNWKLLLGLLVLMITIFTTGIDFRDVGYPEWDLFSESPSSVESYGAKAAILALLGAAAMFIGFIPSGNSKNAKRVDLVVRVTGALALGMTGLYWLLNETEGRPGPYLIAYVPTVVIYVCAISVLITLRYASDRDERQIQEEGRATLSWAILVPIALVVIIPTLGLLAVIYLPEILF